MVNQIILVGNVGNTPVLRKTTEKQINVTNFSVLTVERRKKEGAVQKIVQRHNVVAWDRVAKYCAENISVGDLVMIIGTVVNHQQKIDEKNRKIQRSEVKALRVFILRRKEQR